VLAELGLGPEEIDALERGGVVEQAPDR
jgi:hypothetical protein